MDDDAIYDGQHCKWSKWETRQHKNRKYNRVLGTKGNFFLVNGNSKRLILPLTVPKRKKKGLDVKNWFLWRERALFKGRERSGSTQITCSYEYKRLHSSSVWGTFKDSAVAVKIWREAVLGMILIAWVGFRVHEISTERRNGKILKTPLQSTNLPRWAEVVYLDVSTALRQ